MSNESCHGLEAHSSGRKRCRRLPRLVCVVVLLLLPLSMPSRADAYTNPFKAAYERAKAAWTKAERALDRARDTFRAADSAWRKASAKYNEYKEKLKALGKRLKKAKTEATKAAAALKKLGAQIASLKKGLGSAKDKVLAQAKRLQKKLQELLDTPLTAYSIPMEGRLSANWDTGHYNTALDLGFGITVDNEMLNAWASGATPMPDVDVVKGVQGVFGERTEATDDYDARRRSVQARHGAHNVYFASRRFVAWHSLSNAAGMTGKAILTGGASLQADLAKYKTLLLQEYEDLVAWLRTQGEAQAENLAAEILTSMVAREPVSGPRLRLAMERITKVHVLRLAGTSQIPCSLLPGGLRDTCERAKAFEKRVSEPHIGFSVVLSRSGNAGSIVQRAVQRFSGRRMQGSDLRRRSIARLAEHAGPAVKKILEASEAGSFSSAAAQKAVLRKLLDALRIEARELRSAVRNGNPVIDLRETSIGAQLENWLDDMAQGNQGSAKLIRLEVDVLSARFEAAFTIHHRHGWGTLRQAAAELGAALGGVAGQAGELRDRVHKAAVAGAKKLVSKARAVQAKAQNALNAATKKLPSAQAISKTWADKKAKLQKEYDKLKKKVASLKKKLPTLKKARAAAKRAKDSAGRAAERARKKRDELYRKMRDWLPPLPSVPNPGWW